MYLPLHTVNVPRANLRRAVWSLALGLACFLVSLAANLIGGQPTAYYALQLGLVLTLGGVALAVPYIALAAAVMLSPVATYLGTDSPSTPAINQWWFWIHVLAAIAIGIRLLAIAEKKYPKRDAH